MSLLDAVKNLSLNFGRENGRLLLIEVDTPTFELIKVELEAFHHHWYVDETREKGRLEYYGVAIVKRECVCGAYRNG